MLRQGPAEAGSRAPGRRGPGVGGWRWRGLQAGAGVGGEVPGSAPGSRARLTAAPGSPTRGPAGAVAHVSHGALAW